MLTPSAKKAAEREAEKARCAVCGKKVHMSDLCSDGLYIHVECLRVTSTSPRLKGKV